MREIKFRYAFRSKYSSPTIFFVIFTLGEIERKLYAEQFGLDDYERLGRDEFTGLVDKNGIEIYERDILQKWTIFNEGEGSYAADSYPRYYKYAKPFAVEWSQNARRLGWNLVKGQNHEVVGNAYENPELLK